MNHVPTELLDEVFSYLDWKSLIRATHVCAAWRAIALANYQLWSSVSLHTDAAILSHSTILARSGDLPLSLSLNLQSVSLDSLRRFIAETEPIWPRLRGLHITFTIDQFKVIAEWIRTWRAQMLRDLTLFLDHGPEVLDDLDADNWAPKLRSVSLVNLYVEQTGQLDELRGLRSVETLSQRFICDSSLNEYDILDTAMIFPAARTINLEAWAFYTTDGRLMKESPTLWQNIELTLAGRMFSIFRWLENVAFHAVNIRGISTGEKGLLEFMAHYLPIPVLQVHLRAGRVLLGFETETRKRFRFTDIGRPYSAEQEESSL